MIWNLLGGISSEFQRTPGFVTIRFTVPFCIQVPVCWLCASKLYCSWQIQNGKRRIYDSRMCALEEQLLSQTIKPPSRHLFDCADMVYPPMARGQVGGISLYRLFKMVKI